MYTMFGENFYDARKAIILWKITTSCEPECDPLLSQMQLWLPKS